MTGINNNIYWVPKSNGTPKTSNSRSYKHIVFNKQCRPASQDRECLEYFCISDKTELEHVLTKLNQKNNMI